MIMLVKWYEKLSFSTSEQELSQNSSSKSQATDVDELPMDEWSSAVEDENHYEVVWKTDSSKESDD